MATTTKRKNSITSITPTSITPPTKRIKLTSPPTGTLEELNEKFDKELTESITKANMRTACHFDPNCKRKNPFHFTECSHPKQYCEGDIAIFKEDTDNFIANSFTIYNKSEHINKSLSKPWYDRIKNQPEKTIDQFSQSNYKIYNSFYFLLLANIALHLDEYIDQYTSKFMSILLFSLEDSGVTGLFQVKSKSTIGTILLGCEVRIDNGKLYLSNTTLKECIKNKEEEESTAGGGIKTIKRKTIKRKTIKRKTIKRKRKQT